MDTKFSSFLTVADREIKNAVKRPKLLAIAIAAAIAQDLSLPSGRVDNAAGYYQDTNLPVVNGAVSRFNENMVLTCKEVLAYTFAFWQMRYEAAFPTRIVIATGPCFFNAYLGVDRYFAPEDVCFMDEEIATLYPLIYTARQTLESIKAD